MRPRDTFDDIADIGREFFEGSKSQRILKDYKWQLGTITDLIEHTHSIVAHKLEAVEDSTSIEEAKALVAELEGGPLTASFKANGLCDIFVGFGISLRPLIPTLRSQERQNIWQGFCDTLEARERQVANLYADLLQDLIAAKYGPNTQQELEQLKVAAKNARQKLTTQMADFDALAKRFKKI